MAYLAKSNLVLPQREPGSRKGQNGRVLVIGGSEDYVGAVVLACKSIMRTGVDWVTAAVPEKVGWCVNSMVADVVVKKFSGQHFGKNNVKEIVRLEKDFDVVLLGTGIGLMSAEFVRNYLKLSGARKVIDADALKFVDINLVQGAILTPHKKEFEYLLYNSSITKRELKSKLGSNVVLLKGKVDRIITENKSFYNRTGNEGMTKAGTGDVLAGMVASFYAQNKNALEAAKLGAFYNGKVGDALKEISGYGFLASDMVEFIPGVVFK